MWYSELGQVTCSALRALRYVNDTLTIYALVHATYLSPPLLPVFPQRHTASPFPRGPPLAVVLTPNSSKKHIRHSSGEFLLSQQQIFFSVPHLKQQAPYYAAAKNIHSCTKDKCLNNLSSCHRYKSATFPRNKTSSFDSSNSAPIFRDVTPLRGSRRGCVNRYLLIIAF